MSANHLAEYSLSSRGVATIVLQRDEKRNAINEQMATQLLAILDKAEASAARVIVVRATPDAKVWCAGHDIDELNTKDLYESNPTLAIASRIRSIPCPVVATVTGSVHGGGLLLAMSADIVIATSRARFSIASGRLGLPLSPELLYYWLHTVGLLKTKEMLLTGHPLSADEARIAGLCNRVVAAEELDSSLDEMIESILAGSAVVAANTKRQLNRMATAPTIDATELAGWEQGNAQALNSDDTAKRIAAMRAKVAGS